jgi:hypothetical protein
VTHSLSLLLFQIREFLKGFDDTCRAKVTWLEKHQDQDGKRFVPLASPAFSAFSRKPARPKADRRRQAKCDQLVEDYMEYCLTSGTPFDSIDHGFLRKLILHALDVDEMLSLDEIDMHVQVMRRTAFSTRVLNTVFLKTKDKVDAFLKGKRGTLVSDKWGKHYLELDGLLVFVVVTEEGDAVFFDSHVFDDEAGTAKNLMKLYDSVMTELKAIGFTVTHVISDNEATMLAVRRMMKEKYDVSVGWCIAHRMEKPLKHLAEKQGKNHDRPAKIPQLWERLEDAKAVGGLFTRIGSLRREVRALEQTKLRKKKTVQKLLSQSRVRFLARFTTVKNLAIVKESLVIVMKRHPAFQTLHPREWEVVVGDDSDSFWRDVKTINEVAAPFCSVVFGLQGSSGAPAGAFKALSRVGELLATLENAPSGVDRFRDELGAKLAIEYKAACDDMKEDMERIRLARALNPVFHLCNPDFDPEIDGKLTGEDHVLLMTSLHKLGGDEALAEFKFYSNPRTATEMYVKNVTSPFLVNEFFTIGKDKDAARRFWIGDSIQTRSPVLQTIAVQVLSLTLANTDAERMFRTAAHDLTQYRRHMGAATCNKMLYCHQNLPIVSPVPMVHKWRDSVRRTGRKRKYEVDLRLDGDDVEKIVKKCRAEAHSFEGEDFKGLLIEKEFELPEKGKFIYKGKVCVVCQFSLSLSLSLSLPLM